MIKRFLGETDFASEIRTEIERCITRREPFSTSVEVPRTSDCRKILLLAGEEAERLGHRSVGTEHLLLGMLRAERSLAAQILEGKGLKPADIREQLAEPAVAGNVQARQTRHALSRWCAFLAERKWQKAEDLLPFFAMNAVCGRPRETVEPEGNRKGICRPIRTLRQEKRNPCYRTDARGLGRPA